MSSTITDAALAIEHAGTGEMVVVMMTQVRGASNAKAKRELGWRPQYPSWRTGFASLAEPVPASTALKTGG